MHSGRPQVRLWVQAFRQPDLHAPQGLFGSERIRCAVDSGGLTVLIAPGRAFSIPLARSVDVDPSAALACGRRNQVLETARTPPTVQLPQHTANFRFCRRLPSPQSSARCRSCHAARTPPTVQLPQRTAIFWLIAPGDGVVDAACWLRGYCVLTKRKNKKIGIGVTLPTKMSQVASALGSPPTPCKSPRDPRCTPSRLRKSLGPATPLCGNPLGTHGTSSRRVSGCFDVKLWPSSSSTERTGISGTQPSCTNSFFGSGKIRCAVDIARVQFLSLREWRSRHHLRGECDVDAQLPSHAAGVTQFLETDHWAPHAPSLQVRFLVPLSIP